MDTRGQIINAAYYGQTTLSPIGAAVLLPLLAMVALMSRRWAVAAFVAAVCFISDAQRLNLGGADFTPVRALIAVGVLRVLMRSEYSQIRWQMIDWLFCGYVIWGYFAYAVQYGFEPSALVRRAGEMYTYAGIYFLCRCWLRDGEDVAAFGKALAFIAIPSGLFFAAEWITGRNVFSIFGGVPEFTGMRDGRLRCRGAFPHAILAGCFWAGACPLMACLLWRSAVERIAGLMGLAGALLVIAACASSTPVLALAAMCVAAALFPLRNQMRLIQLGVLLMLLTLHMVRSKPVWHLFGRINVLGSSTGHHRYRLIDAAIAHFADWAPIGVKSTGYWGPQLFDVTNQYLLEGVRGGFLAMLLFIAFLTVAFMKIGKSVRNGRDQATMIQTWLVGAALFGHASTFFSVSYFGQVPVIFYSTLAAAVAATRVSRVGRRIAVPVIFAGTPNAPFVMPEWPQRTPQLATGVSPVLQLRSRRTRWSK